MNNSNPYVFKPKIEFIDFEETAEAIKTAK
jgi:hypothetical protein